MSARLPLTWLENRNGNWGIGRGGRMWREEVIGTEMLVLAVVGEVASRRVSTGTFALRSSSRIPALKLAKTRPFCETDLRGIHLPSPFRHACPVPGEQWGKTGHKPGPAGPAERGFMGQVSPRLSVCKAARSCRYKAEHLFKKREGEGEKHIHLLIKKKKIRSPGILQPTGHFIKPWPFYHPRFYAFCGELC